MSDNNERKWRMYKKAVKEIEFTSCPWSNCSWSSGSNRAQLAYGTNSLGTFTATSNATRSHSNYPYLYNAFTDNPQSRLGHTSSNYKTLDVFLEMPEGVTISPSTLFVKAMAANYKSSKYTFRVEGYNPATESWESLYSNTQYVSSINPFHDLTINCNTENFYSKFLWSVTFIYNSSYQDTAVNGIRIDTGKMIIKP